MNRSEEKERKPMDNGNKEEQFAEANTVSTIEEDNERRPLDKVEGDTKNGELGGDMKKEENLKK